MFPICAIFDKIKDKRGKDMSNLMEDKRNIRMNVIGLEEKENRTAEDSAKLAELREQLEIVEDLITERD